MRRENRKSISNLQVSYIPFSTDWHVRSVNPVIGSSKFSVVSPFAIVQSRTHPTAYQYGVPSGPVPEYVSVLAPALTSVSIFVQALLAHVLHAVKARLFCSLSLGVGCGPGHRPVGKHSFHTMLSGTSAVGAPDAEEVVLVVEVATQLAQTVVGKQPPCAPPKHSDDTADDAQELPAGVEKELEESFGRPVSKDVPVAVGPVGVMVTGPVGMVVSEVTSTMLT